MWSKLWRGREVSPIPFHASLDTELLRFGKRDRFTIRNAVEGVQILGGVGSGKTSGSGNTLLRAYLTAGMGGLVCCAKPDEAERIRAVARMCGRGQDVVMFDAAGTHRFNFMDYARATIGAGGFDTNLVDLIARVSEAARMQSGSGGGKDDQYFRDAANQLLAHALPFLRVAYGTIRLRDLYRFILDAPSSPEEIESRAFIERSFCGATLLLAGQKARAGDEEAQRVADEYGDFWTKDFLRMADRQRASVVSTLTSSIYPFLAGQLHRLFCTDTTLVPELSRQGLILVLDLPTRKFGTAGVIAQQIFKMLWQLAMERETVTDETRPVFAFIDECQFFINSYDAEHLSVCRQQRVCNIFLTQDLPTYYAKIPSKSTAESLLNKFGTRIFHATTDVQTAQYAADLGGRVTRYQASESEGFTTTSGGGVGIGQQEVSGSGNDSRARQRTRSRSTYQDYDIPPDYLGRELRMGGPANRFIVDGILFRNGGPFRSSGRNRLKLAFSQR